MLLSLRRERLGDATVEHATPHCTCFMKQEWIDSLLFDAPLTSEQRALFENAVGEDAALRSAIAHWQQVQHTLRTRLHGCLSNHHVLVLYALDTCGYSSCLTSTERETLATARTELQEAFAAHPVLEDIIKHIQQAATDFDAIWAKQTTPAAKRRDRHDRAPARRSQNKVLRWTWRITAVLAIAAFGVILTNVLQRQTSLMTVETMSGEARVVVLPDSSYVRLLENTKLSYTDPQKVRFNRRIALEGSAFFDVEPTAQPFIVETATALTTVLGTRFGVESTDTVTEVVLETGDVTLASKAAPNQPVKLESGQMSRVAEAALPSTPVDVDLGDALKETGVFYFDNVALDDVLTQLTEHFEVPLTATDDLVAEAINGSFYPYHQPLPEMLETLALTLQADVEEREDGYHLTAR